MKARLQLRLLGTPEASLDGVPALESSPRKAQAALYYLAVTGQPQTRSTLAGLLWGDLPENAARSNLRKVLTNLRQTVGAHLDIDRHNVAFKAECECWIDVAAFESRVGDASSTVDVGQLQQAVELYRGDFLTGFYVLHAPDFEAWMLAEQARLRELVVNALYTLAASYTEPDKIPHGIAYTRRLLALEPWQEEAHRQLMLLLACDGQRSAALAQYDLCRQALAEELGLKPMAETAALYERILANEVTRTVQGQVSPLAAVDEETRGESPTEALPSPAPRPLHNLAAQLTPLIGRETELTELTQLMSDPDVRLVTILGPGGMGKTRLALEVAQAQLTDFPHGVYFVALAPLTSPDSIVPTIVEAINFTFYEGGTLQQQLFDYLRQKQMLLVLDSFEHLLTGAGLIIDLLGAAPGLKILITSRAKLNMQGEQLFPINGIDYPQGAEIPTEAATLSAVKLFLQGARRLRPGFDLNPDNVEHVIQICRWLEGMPLGILLATAWVDLLNPAEIAEEIRHSLDFLESDLRDLPERQQSLRSVFDHSWRLLTEQEQGVFQQLSVFRGGFNHQAAQAVTSASLRDLRALVNKSMLNRTPLGHYEMHDLLRQYGMEKLAGDPALEAKARNRHSAYYCAALQQREVGLKGNRQQTALAELEADAENVRAAWDWAVAQSEVNRLAQALESLCLFYEWRGRYFEGEAACHVVAEKLATLPAATNKRLLAKVLTWQSVFSQALVRTKRADQLVQQSQALLESPDLKSQDIRLEQAFALLQKGRIVFYAHREEARRLFEKSLGLYQAINDRWGTANALDHLAEVARLSADYDQANQLQQDSLAIRRSLGDQKGIISAISVLALNAMFQGQFEAGERLQREIEASLHTLSDRISIANGIFTLGRILALRGRYAESQTRLEESLSVYEDLGLRTGAGLLNLGWLNFAEVSLGDYERARSSMQKVLALGREVGNQDMMAFAHMELSQIALAQGAYAEAQQLAQESIQAYHALGQQKDAAKVWALSGYAARGLRNIPEARQCLLRALRIATQAQSIVPLQFAICLAALLSADDGNYQQALEFHTLAWRQPFVSNSRWFEDVCGRYIAAVTATLPPEMVEAAQERSKACNIWETATGLLAEMEADELSQSRVASNTLL